MIDYQLFKKLCEARSVSGNEGCVRDIILSEIKDHADKITIDNLGNIIVFKKGKKPAKNKLMISAHMDEVGLMITDITSEGYLKFDEIGGIDRRVLLGERVCIGRDSVLGVIGVKPIHLTKRDESESVPKISDMYIDIGAESRQEAEKYVSLGDSASFAGQFRTFLNVGRDEIESKARLCFESLHAENIRRYAENNGLAADGLKMDVIVQRMVGVAKIHYIHVRRRTDNKGLAVHVEVNLYYGVKVFEVARLLQRKIKTRVESMTGMQVQRVNISVRSLELQSKAVRMQAQ